MILIIGGTSQVGLMLADLLNSVHEPFRCLVRESSRVEALEARGAEWIYGDADDPASLIQALDGVDYLIHIAGLWKAGPALDACEALGTVARVVFVSSASRFTKLDSRDPRERTLARSMAEAEDRIKASRVDCVILWAAMIYGLHLDRNIRQVIHWMRKWPVYPNFGLGRGLKNPVYAGDVAWAAWKCTLRADLPRREYIIAGKRPIRQKALLSAIRAALGRRVWLAPVPVWLGYAGVFLYRRLYPDTHINYAMVSRINENSAHISVAAAEDFGYDPLPFETGILRQVEHLKRIGEL
ncbi:MAG: NAD(P)H-binding protein [Peptococcaceae bacterium]|jgi:uncharacterized protein YbjT (DUF2867 family)|nr:NAD(P)H-binding protein [Peptococcaceae bacterium]